MGEVADMILDGTLDEETGELIDGDAPGFPRNMRTGKGFDDPSEVVTTMNYDDDRVLVALSRDTKIVCPQCGRRVKAIGIEQHCRDKHGDYP